MRRRIFCLLGILGAAVIAAEGRRPEPPAPAASRIVAIGDVHGAIESFAAILRKAGLVDQQQRWSGGKAVLVQTGDMSDRGKGMRAALDLLMSLEEQARKADGRVQAILGNHEVMNLVGETRDATPEIFATFGGEAAMRQAFGPRGRYGKWLRSKPVIAEIEDSIFLHGGINPVFSDASVGEINRRARRELTEWDEGVKWLEQKKLVSPSPKFLDAVEAARAELERLAAEPLREHPDTPRAAALLLPLVNIGTSSLFSPEGPLWFRGFSSWTDEEGTPRIAEILKKLGGRRFVTGHTVQSSRRITERFDGRLFLIDTGMVFPSGRASALEIVNETIRPLYVDEE
ncbi:MAG TPA: metallophosphoesterase [Vicinamibacterales bacterium]|nr:metallophosphoesterase [Vicinamibacterales bacterium]